MFIFRAVSWRAVPVAISFMLGIGTVAANASDWIPGERRLPPKVAQFCVIRDVPKFRRNACETSWGRLCADPQFRTWTPAGTDGESANSLWAFLEFQVKLVSQLTEETCGIRSDKLCDSITGDAAVAMIRNEDGEPGIVWLLEVGDKVEEIARKREWIASWLRDETARETQVTIRGTRCLTLEPGKAPDSFELKRLAYFTKDSYLVIATTADLLGSILERWDGKHLATLAGDKTFHAFEERTGIGANARGGELIWFSRGSDDHKLGRSVWLGRIPILQAYIHGVRTLKNQCKSHWATWGAGEECGFPI